MHKFLIITYSTLTLLAFTLPAAASEIGHYAPALARPRDFIMPDPGTYYLQYNAYYSTDTYKNPSGHKVDAVNIGNTPVNIDASVDSYTIAPMVAHVFQDKVLGANYAMYALQPFGNMGFGASLSGTTRGITNDNSSWGIGDTFIEPVWLGWNQPDGQLSLGYGFTIPDGKYDSNSRTNVGYGFWSHQLQGIATHYFDPKKATALIGAFTYEFNEEQKGTHITPGDDMAMNIGLDQLLPVSPKWIGNIGVSLYGQWQTTNDSGVNAINANVHDQVYGVGLNAGLTYLPWLGNIDFHWTHEFNARDRFEGDYYILTLAIPLGH